MELSLFGKALQDKGVRDMASIGAQHAFRPQSWRMIGYYYINQKKLGN